MTPEFKKSKFCIRVFIFVFLFSSFYLDSYCQDDKKPPEPIIINGDTVEYSTDKKEVTASGNVKVIYQGATLTCRKLTVNTETKDGQAEGDVRIEDSRGIIEGKKATYNFQSKAGTIIDAEFRSNPYFGRAEEVKKVSDVEFQAYRGYFSSCSYDHPHYRIQSRKINVFPDDKVQTRHDTLYFWHWPVAYLPVFNRSLKDPMMHVQFMPGKSKDWGPYLLSAWRYNLTRYVSGRIYLDYREKRGVAEGFGANYNTASSEYDFGKGDFKYYYTQERSREFDEGQPAEFQRYFIRWRHKWEIDKQTKVTSEYYKIVDSKRIVLGTNYNILKDYFPREYEKDSLPLSYILFHHSFSSSSLDFLMQKRVNRWYTQVEKLPQIEYSLPSIQIGETPFYFENATQAANLNEKTAVPSPSTDDVSMNRLDLVNKFSMPMKVAFIKFNPFVENKETVYSKDIYGGSISPRTIFYTGADASTKFYRVFNIKSNFLGLNINSLRHVITPTLDYNYNHKPTIPSSKLRQIDDIDSIDGSSNIASFELSNKLQTKRDGQSLDLVDFLVKSSYVFKPKTGDRGGSYLSDFFFELKLLPYSWMRVDADAALKHSGSPSAEDYMRFINFNYDVNFDFGKERTFGFGQRYQRKGGNEFTWDLDWRLTPKWKFSVYERYVMGHAPRLKRGLREQEYSISRDLHCWTVAVNYNVKRGYGESVWFTFKIKAFPEMEFGYDQSYHQPKPGSQSNP